MTSGYRRDSFLTTPFCRGRDHDWLVEPTLARESPADICKSARLQNARYLIAQDGPIGRRPMEVRPAAGCFLCDVHMKHVPALVLPVPNLKHDPALSCIRIEGRTLHNRTRRQDLGIVSDARDEGPSDSQFCPDLPKRLCHVHLGEQMRQRVVHTDHGVETPGRQLVEVSHVGDVKRDVKPSHCGF